MKPAKRLQHVEEYYFSNKLREIQSLTEQGKHIINLGIGNPDLPPPPQVIKSLQDAVCQNDTHGYQPYKGLPVFRKSVADFYQKHYQVTLNPETEVLPLFGAKEGIMHLSMAFLNKIDKVLIPNPGYAAYESVTKLVEAEPVYYDLSKKNHWQPDWKQLEKLDVSNVKMMWVNYPNMPTGAKATTELFEKLIAFGKKHDILIVNDNPYSFILTEKPMSILSVEGSRDVAVELNSLSKTFNMAGWRIGMLVGNKNVINQTLKVKSNMDSGMFYGLQMGGIAAMKLSGDWFKNLDKLYEKRREIVWKIADALGYTYDKNAEGFFVWAKLPQGSDSYQISDLLLEKYQFFATPGSIFGSNGQQYIRFSLCVSEEKLEEVLRRIKT